MTTEFLNPTRVSSSGIVVAILGGGFAALVFSDVSLGEVALSAFGGVALYGGGAFAFHLVRAPVELRHEREADAFPLEIAVSYSQHLHFEVIYVKGEQQQTFSITYKGNGKWQETDYAEWDKPMSRIHQKALLPGEHAYAVALPVFDASIVDVQFNSNGAPRRVRYHLRESTLGVQQIRADHEPWPNRDTAWAAGVDALRQQVRDNDSQLDELDRQVTWQSIHELTAPLFDLVRTSAVVGPSFHRQETDAYGQLRDRHDDASIHEIPPAEVIEVYRAVLAAWDEQLTRALDAGTDDPDVLDAVPQAPGSQGAQT